MVTRNEAVELVRARLASSPDQVDAVVIEGDTLEYDFGWVFFYNSEAFVTSRNWRDSLVGNAPFIVDRRTGQLFETGTAHPVEVYVEAYKKYGDPHARPGRVVKLTGWREGAVAVSAIKAVRAYSGTSLAEAKRCVERALDGKSASFEAKSVEAAVAAVKELHACGFGAEQVREGRAA